MILEAEKRIIRFGLTDAEGSLNSPLWRLWAQGDETYLAVRTAIGISKISLHRSGRWVLTAGTGTVPIKGPRRLSENWVAGPRIVFPGVPPLSALGAYSERIKKRVFLYAGPQDGQWRDFAVLFSGSRASTDEVSRLLPIGSDLIGPLRHRSGNMTWLATFVTPMTEDQVGFIRAERDKFRVSINGEGKSLPSTMAMIIQDTVDGDTMLVNFSLSRENFVRA